MTFITDHARVLLIGVGGVGCEILKNLLLYGIHEIQIVDMDTVQLSNLNRQFLFKSSDIGRPKVEAALDWALERFPHYSKRLTGYYRAVEELSPNFLASFHIIIGALDSVKSRCWINSILIDLDRSIPYVDSGSEGYTGHCITVISGLTACIGCVLPLFKQDEQIPLCSLAGNINTLADCIRWAAFVKLEALDLDSEKSVNQIIDLTLLEANSYSIDSAQLNSDFVRSTLKNVIPAISTTNSVVGGICTRRVMEILDGLEIDQNFQNYTLFNGHDEVYLEHINIKPSNECHCQKLYRF